MRRVEDRLGPYTVELLEPEDHMNETEKPAGHPRFHEIVKKMTELHEKKNSDYAGHAAEGPLGNFIRVARIKKMYPGFEWDTPFGVAMAYYLKQLDAVMHMYAEGTVSKVDEGIPERLMDMATYAPIMIILLEEPKV